MTRHTTDPARLSSREAHSALWSLALLLGPEDELARLPVGAP